MPKPFPVQVRLTPVRGLRSEIIILQQTLMMPTALIKEYCLIYKKADNTPQQLSALMYGVQMFTVSRTIIMNRRPK